MTHDRQDSYAQRAETGPVGSDSPGLRRPGPSPDPELRLLISSAVDAVRYTFDIDAEADSALVDEIRRVVTAETSELYASMAAIAARAEQATRGSRELRVAEVARAAEAMAIRVAEIAAALNVTGEANASRVGLAASDAAELVGNAGVDQSGVRAAGRAAEVAAAVRAAAAAALRERGLAAALIAETAASAAAEVARAAELENVTLELAAATNAAAVRAIALDTCYQAAVDVAATTAERALRRRNGTD